MATRVLRQNPGRKSNYRSHLGANGGKQKVKWSLENQRTKLEIIALTCRYHCFDQWYGMTARGLIHEGAATIVKKYNGSTHQALSAVFPEHRWVDTKFANAPHRHWDNKDNQRALFDQIGKNLGVVKPSDWYKIRFTDAIRLGAGSVINKYGGLSKALMAIYKERTWSADMFVVTTKRKSAKTRRNKELNVRELKARFKVKSDEEWHTIATRLSRLNKEGISSKLSVSRLARKLYGRYKLNLELTSLKSSKSKFQSIGELQPQKNPDKRRHPVRRAKKRRKYKSKQPSIQHQVREPTDFMLNNQRAELDAIGEQLQIKCMNDWYSVSLTDLARAGADWLNQRYKRSMLQLLSTVYANRTWHAWKFKYNYREIKLNESLVQCAMKMAEEMNITNPEQWYRLSILEVAEFGGQALSNSYPQILHVMYPNVKWRWQNFDAQHKKSTQRCVVSCVKILFPQTQVEEEHHIGHFQCGTPMLVDVFVPAYNIAIEYQGEQHYHDIYPQPPATLSIARDAEKEQHIKNSGFYFVPIPYSWRGDLDSLAATISYYVPTWTSDHNVNNTKPLVNVSACNTGVFSQGLMTPMA